MNSTLIMGFPRRAWVNAARLMLVGSTIVAGILAPSATAYGGFDYREPFDTDANHPFQSTPAYDTWATWESVGGFILPLTYAVSSGHLEVFPGTRTTGEFTSWRISAFNSSADITGSPGPFDLSVGPLTVIVDIGAFNDTHTSFHPFVGVRVGDIGFLFHPDFDEDGIGGGFWVQRVDGSQSFVFKQDMGFTPATDVFHHCEITLSDAGGDAVRAEYTIGSFSGNHTMPAANYGALDKIGFTMSNNGSGEAFTLWADNLVVTPEPTTLSLLGLGALALMRRRRK